MVMRMQRWFPELRGLCRLGEQCPVCVRGPREPSTFDLERVQTRMYGTLTCHGLSSQHFPTPTCGGSFLEKTGSTGRSVSLIPALGTPVTPPLAC